MTFARPFVMLFLLFIVAPTCMAMSSDDRVLVGADVRDKYFFRGIVQEDQDAIVQPYVFLQLPVFDAADQWVDRLAIGGRFWSSLHDGPSGRETAVGSARAWFEARISADLYVGVQNVVDVRLSRTSYMSPNNAFASIDEYQVRVDVEDGLWMGAWALNPHVEFAIESRGQADGGAHRGGFLEAGIEPSKSISLGEGCDWDVSLPIAVGLSLFDYYESFQGEDKHLGYVDVGLKVKTALGFIPERMGRWALSLSGSALFLGAATKTFNGNEAFESTIAIGLAVSF